MSKVRDSDPALYEVLVEASTCIESGYPTLADHRTPWTNKVAKVSEQLTQFRSNYQYVFDDITVKIKTLEYKEYMDSIDNDQFKSWNEKSLSFYGNSELVDWYRHLNYNKFVLSIISEYVTTLRNMSR